MAASEEAAPVQAEMLSRYLIGKPPGELITKLYTAAVEAETALSPREQVTLSFAFRHPWAVGVLDAGLALLRPHAELRRRIYIMLALLEAAPEYHRYFLPREHSPFYVVIIGLVGVRSVLRLAVGLTLVKFLESRT